MSKPQEHIIFPIIRVSILMMYLLIGTVCSVKVLLDGLEDNKSMNLFAGCVGVFGSIICWSVLFKITYEEIKRE